MKRAPKPFPYTDDPKLNEFYRDCHLVVEALFEVYNQLHKLIHESEAFTATSAPPVKFRFRNIARSAEWIVQDAQEAAK
jgi:hypothetical protein